LKSIFAAAPVKVAIATLLVVVGEYENVGATYDEVVTTTGAGVLLVT
jgi:hypothetical protein